MRSELQDRDCIFHKERHFPWYVHTSIQALTSNAPLGDAFQNIKSDRLYPSVGIKKPGEHLRINFGQTPFVYDIDSMMEVSQMLQCPFKY